MNELPVNLSGRNVLVVDDVPANPGVLCQSLEAVGYLLCAAR